MLASKSTLTLFLTLALVLASTAYVSAQVVVSEYADGQPQVPMPTAVSGPQQTMPLYNTLVLERRLIGSV